MTIDRATMSEMRVGSFVHTADGERIGSVKEVRGGCFKVDAPMRPDFWLTTDCVTSATGGQVRLNVSKDRLSDYKVDGPGEGDDTTDRGIHGSTVVTGERSTTDRDRLSTPSWDDAGTIYRQR